MSKDKIIKMSPVKNIALVAHDGKKREIIDWSVKHRDLLSEHKLFATGTTGSLIAAATGLEITSFRSGPLGGDQQIGAGIVEGQIDMMFFFWDPLETQPHDPDVKALLRIATLFNIPVATNLATADFIVSSQYMNGSYEKNDPDYSAKITRKF